MRVTRRLRQKQRLFETATRRYSIPRKASVRQSTCARSPAPVHARIWPIAGRVTWDRSEKPDWPPVRLRPPALLPVFRPLRAILVLADLHLAATATARPRPPARLLKAACLPRLIQSRN